MKPNTAQHIRYAHGHHKRSACNPKSPLIDLVTDLHEPILISGEHSNAVLVSKADGEAIQESLFLLSVPGMRESIKDRHV